jgi:predicted SAM-dependent methyltransferase
VSEIKLNLCSGGADKEGFVNIDKNALTKPTLLLDITKEKFPYGDGEVDEVWFMHGLEHIERQHWDNILMEILRVLKTNGKLVLGYPEWKVCAMNYMNDTGGRKEYWLQTLYGRRFWTGDEHVTAVNSEELQQILESCGYFRVRFAPESDVDYYNAIMVAFKDPQPQCRELLIASEMALPGTAVSIQDVV